MLSLADVPVATNQRSSKRKRHGSHDSIGQIRVLDAAHRLAGISTGLAVGRSTYLTDSMIWISCFNRPFTISPSGMPF